MQLIFKDRIDAARKLAEKLEHLKKEEPIILAIPRGGVVTGAVIADTLDAKLDVVVPRKLGAPYNPELAIGAVMHDGTYFLNHDIVDALNLPRQYIDGEIAAQMAEVKRRLMLFRGSEEYDLEGKIVILVDDGIATGATIFASMAWVKKQKPKKLVVAAPVAPRETLERLKQMADEVVIVSTPVLFGAVGEFYQDFRPVNDSEVQDILKKYKHTTSIKY